MMHDSLLESQMHFGYILFDILLFYSILYFKCTAVICAINSDKDNCLVL